MRTTLAARVAVVLLIAAGCNVGPEDEGDVDVVGSPIIGGSLASGFPESALIGMSRNGRTVAACSGSIIAPRVALTAGHCVAGFDGWTVRAPFANNQSTRSSQGETFDWRDDGSEQVNPNLHDIGLIYLDAPINLSQFPVIADRALADGSSILNIGRINNGTLSNTQLFVSKPITVRSAARQGFPFDYVATEVIESGDSGGPDVVPGTNPHVIAAVNSGAGGGTEVLARTDLLRSFILGKIADHGGGGTTPPPTMPPPTQPPTPGCNGPKESEPNDDFQAPNALGASVCGNLGGTDTEDWYTWSIAGATPYSLKLTASGDAAIAMWKRVGNGFSRVANTSNTEISHVSSGAGSYVLAIFTGSGAAQSYSLTLAK
jgi:hypothetical protein